LEIKSRFVFWAVILVALLGLFAWMNWPTQEVGNLPEKVEQAAPAKPQGLPVQAVPVIVGELLDEITAIGTVGANESVRIRTEIDGRLLKLNFDEGQSVKKGQVLVVLDDGEHRAELAAINAELRTEKQRFLRTKELYEKKFISKEALDLQAGAVDRLAAMVQGADARLQKTVVTAPFSGAIGLRKVSLGAYLQAGDDIARLEDISSVKVDFRVPEVFLAKVRSGQSISVVVDAFPNAVFNGKVYAIEAGMDRETRTALVRAKISNKTGKLRSGMFARVSLLMAKKKDALSVPEQALWPQGTDNFVFKVIDGKVALTKVELGQRTPGYVEILKGLSPGDLVVTEGQMKIRDGAPVTVLGGGQ
tara:strand:+ start:3817 stop:4902 length:1086 start_codon:yes stop_codon:yes gene_type:complete